MGVKEEAGAGAWVHTQPCSKASSRSKKSTAAQQTDMRRCIDAGVRILVADAENAFKQWYLHDSLGVVVDLLCIFYSSRYLLC